MLEESGMLDELPKWARSHFDFASYVRDLECDGWSTVECDGSTFLVNV
jgi:hypothetical protein